MTHEAVSSDLVHGINIDMHCSEPLTFSPPLCPSPSGRRDGIGVENLKGSGMIAGETSQAYEEVFTINLVSLA